MNAYPWIDLRALGAQAGAVAADAARSGVRRFVLDEASASVTDAPARAVVSRAGAVQLVDDAAAPLAGRRVRIDGARDFDAARDAIRRHAFVVIDYALATTVPLERFLADAGAHACRIVVSLAEPHAAAYLARKYERAPVDIAFAPRDASALRDVLAACGASRPLESLVLEQFEVLSVEPLGTGPHAIVDGCSRLDDDESVLVGATATSMLLVKAADGPHDVAQPLAFAISAGSAESFVSCGGERTRKLALLRSGERILTVGAGGALRTVVVGRVRIEAAPLVALHARSASGARASVVMRADRPVLLTADDGARVALSELAPGRRLAGVEPGIGWIDCRMQPRASRLVVAVDRQVASPRH
ncbi:3-dehydroquinate synthase II [Burkholderia stagnalis]|uniref:3-dehydroquinate synthase II n=1 Tax=Burkholderia stagnalis TaxID=1503054 RepID=UPI0007586BB4|nr:3-dehydroquinate synthase II [Burkholderia stagnalis]KVL85862.1 3-dehydroquinate synthase [Burkholderia stagnalis]KVL94583.1 3-dehydroquinate synthase [Burkholderia stagnalis]KVM09171.1 3-dehydroquinate synthase [Burkholderia stagnalis]